MYMHASLMANSVLEELAQLESESSDQDSYHEAEERVEQHVRDIDEQIKAIPPSLYFRLKNGEVLKSKQDLAHALRDMEDSVFRHHVNDSHNDFADWLELALEDPQGEQLRGKSRDEMAQMLADLCAFARVHAIGSVLGVSVVPKNRNVYKGNTGIIETHTSIGISTLVWEVTSWCSGTEKQPKT